MLIPLLLWPFFKLIDLVREESFPSQIAAGIVLGFCLGLSPPFTLHWALLCLALVLLRANSAASFASFVLFSQLSPFVEPCFHSVGMHLLTGYPELRDALAWMFNAEVIPFTRFYNSVVLGSLVFCTLVSFPLFILATKLISRHFDRIQAFVLGSAPWRDLEDSQWYAYYVEYEKKRG